MNDLGEAPQRSRAVYGPYLTLGLQLAITVVVFFFLGRWLDGKFGTEPWLMLAGLAVGVTGGLTGFLMKAFALGKEEDREEAERKKESGREPEK
ncbi:MAG TPA: AtpZ/AtpI family protein [Bacteroidota bacterium]|nr:AtpZ/AtpI family protein [Bacteroidota bacterium]